MALIKYSLAASEPNGSVGMCDMCDDMTPQTIHFWNPCCSQNSHLSSCPDCYLGPDPNTDTNPVFWS